MGRSITFDMREATLDDLRRQSAFFPLEDKPEAGSPLKEIVQVPLEIYIALFLPFLLGFILTS